MWISPDGCQANWFCCDAGSSEMVLFQKWRKIPLAQNVVATCGKIRMAETQFHVPDNKVSYSVLHGIQNVTKVPK
jgi:hypothetical protein